MDVSENNGTPKSSILKGFSIINHPFWGTPIFGNTHMFGEDFDQYSSGAPGWLKINTKKYTTSVTGKVGLLLP